MRMLSCIMPNWIQAFICSASRTARGISRSNCGNSLSNFERFLTSIFQEIWACCQRIAEERNRTGQKHGRNRHTVLIADDDKLILSSLRYALTQRGYKVLLAQNGVAAIVNLERVPVDIVSEAPRTVPALARRFRLAARARYRGRPAPDRLSLTRED